MRRSHLTILTLLFLSASALAQPVVESRKSTLSPVEFFISNTGAFGSNPDPSAPGLFYPRGSGRAYLFGSGLWFGARKRWHDTLARLSFITYNPNSGVSWGWPGDAAGEGNDPAPLYVSTEVDPVTGGDGAGKKPAWPLWRDDVLRITMMSPGYYVSDTAARVPHPRGWNPAFVPDVDEEFVARFNDTALTRYEIGASKAIAYGYPLGLQVMENVYAWSRDPFGASVIVQYEIVNVGSDTLRDCYVGQMTDMDIGRGGNDNCGWFDRDTTLRAMAAWTETSGETTGPFGTLVTAAIETPVVDGSTHRVDNLKRGRRDLQAGLTAARTILLANDPKKPEARYDALATSGRDVNPGPSDQRGLISSGPFDLFPGDTVHFALSHSIVDAPSPAGADAAARIGTIVRALNAVYYGQPFSGVEQSVDVAGASAVTVLPNPATSSTMLRCMIPGATSVELTLLDLLGRPVQPVRSIMAPDGRLAAGIDCSTLAPGAYVAVISGGGVVRTARIVVAH
jgi:hypothetical protein